MVLINTDDMDIAFVFHAATLEKEFFNNAGMTRVYFTLTSINLIVDCCILTIIIIHHYLSLPWKVSHQVCGISSWKLN
jgi:ABC-type uncharacterized transport system permease subunit